MDIRDEIKSLIAKNATTLKQVCIDISEKSGKSIVPNNLTNKLRRKTIKFTEVLDIINTLGYHIEIKKNK